MQPRRYRLAWLALVVALAAPAHAAAQGPAPVPAPTEAGVVLRFHNGSVVQPAVLLESIEIDTKLGKLAIPAAELRSIDFGFRLSDKDQKTVEQAVRDLGSPKDAARAAAAKTLLRLGRLAYPALLDARKSGDVELTKRVESLLKDVRARTPAERLKVRRHDLVRTSDSTVAGQITTGIIRVRCDLLGEVKIPVHQLRELRSLLPGGDVTAVVDAARYGNKASWLETEFEVLPGSRLEITATGAINLAPGGQLGNNPAARNVKPDGTPQFVSGEGPQPGKLLGKIGTDGPTFEIGSRYSGAPTREGKLFLRIVTIEHANNIKAGGSYQVKISAEPN